VARPGDAPDDLAALVNILRSAKSLETSTADGPQDAPDDFTALIDILRTPQSERPSDGVGAGGLAEAVLPGDVPTLVRVRVLPRSN
jgi:hypothetical protein